ncbi:hypothetical protein D9619_004876 [Psilocybe cf. subviscida]|uniref:Mediator of RNA polymerase II transcription subunit 19 n=1 Tax=Psilocybe cf. subviscida TaxID=2480587 RepID=A0A8H5F7Y1_9AGAR|nr:hypothetical protein D9619_004876 [Psilocybe cf. subviscida]
MTQHLAATQDLLARFNLLSAYDRYVRPPVLPGDDPSIPNNPDGAVPTPGPGVDKGKGKERDGNSAPTPAAEGHGHDGDEDEAVGKGEKKKKNTYKHLIKGVPGKHSLKKDDYLSSMMLQPPKQRMRIRAFDQKTQDDAFTVSLEGIKGWNVNTLVVESDQAREDRKKRKELKRLAKLQGLQGGLPLPSVVSTPVATASVGTPRPSSAAGFASTPVSAQSIHAPTPITIPRKTSSAGTPKSATPRPGSRAEARTPAPGVSAVSPIVAGLGSGVGAGTPAPGAGIAGAPPRNGVPRSTVPRPGSTVPRPGSAVPRPGSAAAVAKKQQQLQSQTQTQAQGQQQRPPQPQYNGLPQRPSTPAHTPMDVDSGQRGQKRIRDEGAVGGIQNPYAVPPNSGKPTGYGAPTVASNGYSNTNGINGANVNGATNINGNVNGSINGAVNGQVRPPVMNAKAGSGGIRPRPIKKQRMDTQGQSRDVSQPVQQPTPQGA